MTPGIPKSAKSEVDFIAPIRFFDSRISIYPNPSNGIVNIKMETESNYTLSVFDTAGRKLIHQTFTGASTSVEVGEFSSGLYFVEVVDAKKNIVYREKVIR